jgi:glycosyltransferase involved in cell wall biosynthesis
VPEEASYRGRQRAAIQGLLPALIAQETPDVLFVGRETFVADVVDVARDHGIPCVLRLAGGTTLGLLNGAYPEALARELLDACRRVQRIVSPARHLAARAVALGLTDVVVILNAIDTELFAPRPKSPTLLRALGIPDDAVVVAHLSNLKPIKRSLDVVSSAREALPRDPRLLYMIVGDGAARPALEAACRRAGIQERVRFVGWVDYPAVPDYVNLADVVVMPSEDEALARVYLETQACGRLLLASDIPAAREVVVEGETGLLYRSGDIADLTRQTLRAAANAGLRAAIGGKAREQAQRHRLVDAAARYTSLMGGLIQDRSPVGSGGSRGA